jgi:NAD-dependent deacetylase
MADMLEEITHCLQAARAVAVLTGAGVSAESGVPTFRDALTGLWARFDPQQLATPEAFARDPALVTRWYDERRVRCADSRPNPGHYALAQLEQRFLASGRAFTLLTQNVDRLHQRAGSQRVVELHGSLCIWRCSACSAEHEEKPAPFGVYPPRCRCGGVLRPGVVWFGEALPDAALASAYSALEGCDVFLSLGTSAIVEPAASFVRLAPQASTIEINLDATPISNVVNYSLRAKTGEVLPRIIEQLRF